MYATHEKKKNDMMLTISIDQTKIAKGHRTFPKAGAFKDKRRMPKVAQRVQIRREG